MRRISFPFFMVCLVMDYGDLFCLQYLGIKGRERMRGRSEGSDWLSWGTTTFGMIDREGIESLTLAFENCNYYITVLHGTLLHVNVTSEMCVSAEVHLLLRRSVSIVYHANYFALSILLNSSSHQSPKCITCNLTTPLNSRSIHLTTRNIRSTNNLLHKVLQASNHLRYGLQLEKDIHQGFFVSFAVTSGATLLGLEDYSDEEELDECADLGLKVR